MYDYERILERLDYLFNILSQTVSLEKFKVNLHPATKKILRFKNILNDINRLKKKYKNSKMKKKNSLSLHIGNTSTIIEALESGSDVIHVCSSDFFDPLTSDYWNSVKSKKIGQGIFNYKLKRRGHCVTFNKQVKSINL